MRACPFGLILRHPSWPPQQAEPRQLSRRLWRLPLNNGDALLFLPRHCQKGPRCGCLLTGKPGAPVMGRNTHVIFREFQEVFGSRHPTVRHKESIVHVLSLFVLLCPGHEHEFHYCQGSGWNSMFSAGAGHWDGSARTEGPPTPGLNLLLSPPPALAVP